MCPPAVLLFAVLFAAPLAAYSPPRGSWDQPVEPEHVYVFIDPDDDSRQYERHGTPRPFHSGCPVSGVYRRSDSSVPVWTDPDGDLRGRELTIIEGGTVVMAVADDSVVFVYLDNTFADIALPGPPPDYRKKRRQRMTAIVDTRPWWTVADAGGILAFTSNGGHERWINPRIPEVVRVFDKAPSARQPTPAELAAFEAALGKDPDPRKRDD